MGTLEVDSREGEGVEGVEEVQDGKGTREEA